MSIVTNGTCRIEFGNCSCYSFRDPDSFRAHEKRLPATLLLGPLKNRDDQNDQFWLMGYLLPTAALVHSEIGYFAYIVYFIQ